MTGFTFKQFHVDDYGCGQPVSTDGVLLGAWAVLPAAGTVLDIGTGSGLLALMAAQRAPDCRITAVELAPAAAAAAERNVAASPWQARIQVVTADITTWHAAEPFSSIVCNPPWFSSGLRAACQTRARARHQDSLDVSGLLTTLARLLHEDGLASLILPLDEGERLLEHARDHGLFPHRLCQVQSLPSKPPHRLLLTLGRTEADCQTEQLTIHATGGGYSDDFAALTRAFYLKL